MLLSVRKLCCRRAFSRDYHPSLAPPLLVCAPPARTARSQPLNGRRCWSLRTRPLYRALAFTPCCQHIRSAQRHAALLRDGRAVAGAFLQVRWTQPELRGCIRCHRTVGAPRTARPVATVYSGRDSATTSPLQLRSRHFRFSTPFSRLSPSRRALPCHLLHPRRRHRRRRLLLGRRRGAAAGARAERGRKRRPRRRAAASARRRMTPRRLAGGLRRRRLLAAALRRPPRPSPLVPAAPTTTRPSRRRTNRLTRLAGRQMT